MSKAKRRRKRKKLEKRAQARKRRENYLKYGSRFSFWDNPSLDDLLHEQGFLPGDEKKFDITSLYGTWPGDVDDGFEEAIEKHRYEDWRKAS